MLPDTFMVCKEYGNILWMCCVIHPIRCTLFHEIYCCTETKNYKPPPVATSPGQRRAPRYRYYALILANRPRRCRAAILPHDWRRTRGYFSTITFTATTKWHTSARVGAYAPVMLGRAVQINNGFGISAYELNKYDQLSVWAASYL